MKKSIKWIDNHVDDPDIDILIELEKLTEEFLAIINYERRKKGIRIDDLAKEMKCSRSTMKRILNKETDLKLINMIKLCSILEMKFILRIG